MLNKTDQSWFMLWQLVGGITDGESVKIKHKKNCFGRDWKFFKSAKKFYMTDP